MVEGPRQEEWNWLDEPRSERFQELWAGLKPLGAVIERGPVCSKCRREVEVLLFVDPRIKSEAELRKEAQRLIREAREDIDKHAEENPCGDHNLQWAMMP